MDLLYRSILYLYIRERTGSSKPALANRLHYLYTVRCQYSLWSGSVLGLCLVYKYRPSVVHVIP